MSEKMTPEQAKTFDDIAKLSHDNILTVDGASMLLAEDDVSIYPSDGSAHYVTITRRDFEEMIAWYRSGIVPKGDKGKR